MADMTLRDAADMAGSVLRGGAKIATAIWNVEEKIFDTYSSTTPLSGSPNIQCVTIIAQGTDYNQREGLSIKARNLLATISAVGNATAGTNFVRIIFFQDLENRGVAPTAAEVLENTGSLAYNSYYNHVLAERFRVLSDEHIILIAGQQAYFKRLVMPVGSHILFTTSAAAVAAQYEGTIYFMVFTDNATNGPVVSIGCRLTYVDN